MSEHIVTRDFYRALPVTPRPQQARLLQQAGLPTSDYDDGQTLEGALRTAHSRIVDSWVGVKVLVESDEEPHRVVETSGPSVCLWLKLENGKRVTTGRVKPIIEDTFGPASPHLGLLEDYPHALVPLGPLEPKSPARYRIIFTTLRHLKEWQARCKELEAGTVRTSHPALFDGARKRVR